MSSLNRLAQTLVEFAALTHQLIGELSAPGGSVDKAWLEALSQPARDHINRCRELSAAFPEDSEIGSALADHCLALEETFAAPYLNTPRLTVEAVLLLLWSIEVFLYEGFELCCEAAGEAGGKTLTDACRTLADTLRDSAERDRPHSSPEDYERDLSPFAQADRSKDPVGKVIVRLEQPQVARSWAPRRPQSVAVKLSVNDVGIANANLAGPSSCRVWYGTNRTPLQPTDIAEGFSAARDTTLHFGSCVVYVPRAHVVGSIGSSWLKRTLILGEDDRLRVEAIEDCSREQFVASISAELATRKDGRTALLYVHGFNVSFDEAARRAAQMACDLSVNGVAAFFSWPSAGAVLSYALDGDVVSASAEQFWEFLETLFLAHNLERVDIVAHSMGNRLLADVIKALSQAPQRDRIGHLILAAPDISRTKFATVRDFYPAAASKRVTLYSCGRDLALFASTILHRYTRIGYEPPPYIHAGIDTISARRINLDMLGHGYIASSRPAIADLKKLLWENLEPSQRGLIAQPTAKTPAYWLLAEE